MRNQDRSVLLWIVLALAVACGGGGGADDASAPAQADAPAADPEPSAAMPAGTATIAGTATFTGTPPPPRPVRMDADPGCAKKHDGPVEQDALVLGDGQTLANVIVRVRSGHPQQRYPVPETPAVLDQVGCRYAPHVLGVQVGQAIEIRNSDGLLHNVHALPSVNGSFNRAMPPAVTEFRHVFDEPEAPFRIKCDVHPWMGAWVEVFDHPWFSVSGADGRFEITGLPAGTYEIEAWHELLGTRSATVTVGDGESGTADFAFERPATG